MEATQPKTVAAALWSLILGIAGIVLCVGVLTGIPGLILGIVGLKQIKNAPGELSGRGLAIGGIVTSAISLFTSFIVLASFAVSFPVYGRIAERAEEMKSINQVRQLVIACRQYADDYDGNLPADFQALKDEGLLFDDLVLISPLSPDQTPESSYELLQTGNLDALPSGTPIIRDKNVSSRGKVAVGYAGGYAYLVDEAELAP